MTFIDYILLFIFFISICFGLSRGFTKEVISLSFFCFNIYIFSNYHYFASFYFKKSTFFIRNNFFLSLLLF